MDSCYVNGIATIGCFPFIIKLLINAGFTIAGTVCLIFLIIGGMKFVWSRGDPKEAETAQHTMTYAIIGLIVVLLSVAILNFLANITNASCITRLDFKACL